MASALIKAHKVAEALKTITSESEFEEKNGITRVIAAKLA